MLDALGLADSPRDQRASPNGPRHLATRRLSHPGLSEIRQPIFEQPLETVEPVLRGLPTMEYAYEEPAVSTILCASPVRRYSRRLTRPRTCDGRDQRSGRKTRAAVAIPFTPTSVRPTSAHTVHGTKPPATTSTVRIVTCLEQPDEPERRLHRPHPIDPDRTGRAGDRVAAAPSVEPR
jgi:hypothetical protein